MTYEERMKWFLEARFGIYVHFGLYSLLGRGEWTMYSERIPQKTYAALADQFLPKEGCAEEWVETAVAAGAKYYGSDHPPSRGILSFRQSIF